MKLDYPWLQAIYAIIKVIPPQVVFVHLLIQPISWICSICLGNGAGCKRD